MNSEQVLHFHMPQLKIMLKNVLSRFIHLKIGKNSFTMKYVLNIINYVFKIDITVEQLDVLIKDIANEPKQIIWRLFIYLFRYFCIYFIYKLVLTFFTIKENTSVMQVVHLDNITETNQQPIVSANRWLLFCCLLML